MKQKVKCFPVILIMYRYQEVMTLDEKLWISDSRKTTVCIDSYEDGVFRGRFYDSDGTALCFGSLSRFLLMMEDLLKQAACPQPDTTHRSFSACLQQPCTAFPCSSIRAGALATFDLQILFRRHTSWQGVIVWQEQNLEQNIRSVLELILLMDSALRSPNGKAAG